MTMDKDKLGELESVRRQDTGTPNYQWPTFRESGPLEHFGQIGIAFTDADNTLSKAIGKHGEDMEAMEQKLAGEASARANADTALDTKVANEAKARADADTATNSKVQGLEQSKADKTALQALQTTVNGKADSSAVTTLSNTVANKVSKTTIASLSDDADLATVVAKVNQILSALK